MPACRESVSLRLMATHLKDSKLVTNMCPSVLRVEAKASRVGHTASGVRISGGTPGMDVGTCGDSGGGGQGACHCVQGSRTSLHSTN